MKKILSFVFASLLTFSVSADLPCAIVRAYYTGPAGGVVCGNGNCGSQVALDLGWYCNEPLPDPNAFLTIDLSGVTNPCAQGGTHVATVIIFCKNGNSQEIDITMPQGACYADYYIYGTCDQFACSVAACRKSRVICTCNQ